MTQDRLLPKFMPDITGSDEEHKRVSDIMWILPSYIILGKLINSLKSYFSHL